MSTEGSELLRAVKQMNARKRGRVYTPEQLLAISARQSVNLTQKEFARLLNVSIDSVQDWEQGTTLATWRCKNAFTCRAKLSRSTGTNQFVRSEHSRAVRFRSRTGPNLFSTTAMLRESDH